MAETSTSIVDEIRSKSEPVGKYPGSGAHASFYKPNGTVYLTKGLMDHLGNPERLVVYVNGGDILVEPASRESPASKTFKLAGKQSRLIACSAMANALSDIAERSLPPGSKAVEPTILGHDENDKPYAVWRRP